MAAGEDVFIIDLICKKLNRRFEKIKRKKMHWVCIINNTSSGAGDVASMATNLATEGDVKIKRKR